MMSWSPTPRRDAGSGLATLWLRPDWRASPHAKQIEATLRSMLTDADDVLRLHAARVIDLLEANSPGTLALIHERVCVEQHPYVAATLIGRLSGLSFEHADEMDRIVADAVGREPWATLLGPGGRDGDRDVADPIVRLVLGLAIRARTANATALAERWFTDPVGSEAARRCMWLVRGWLALPADRSDERHRAFELAKSAAIALQAVADGTDDESRLKAAYESADVLSNQVFFASGAFGDKGQNPTDAPEGFAEEAFDLLDLLAAFRHPSNVHHIVQTAKHLALVDPRRAFAIVNSAIRPGEPYSYDRTAANSTISLIERYLADFREIVLMDHNLLSQIRAVLDAFVRVGWPSAVSLSYRLSSAFR